MDFNVYNLCNLCIKKEKDLFICWELSSKIKDGSILRTSVEDETRILHIIPGTNGKIKRCYLDSDNATIKIKVICLKDYITQKWGITLFDQ